MIYVITHKIFDSSILTDSHYRILHVGKNSNSKDDYLKDDVDDNISEKNKSFCELTGLYWIWKNINCDPDEITGIVHYRRYFCNRLNDIRYAYCNVLPTIISYKDIKKYLNQYDIILPKPIKSIKTAEEVYKYYHHPEDLELTKKVISELNHEYLTTFNKVLNYHFYYYGNMMICTRKMLTDYCSWLFPILFEVERKNDETKYRDTYQSRVYGFLAERLLPVWVIYNNYKIKELPVFNTEEKSKTIFEWELGRIKKHL